jgi:ArsR family metal-binding transcriptional regulator
MFLVDMETKDLFREPEAPIKDYELELCEPPCRPGADTWSARASLPVDISGVLPYLNARLKTADYDHRAGILIWKEKNRSYAFRPREINAAPAGDREEARQLIEEAVALVNDTWAKRDSIEADFTKRTVPDLMRVYRSLPRTNCGECGFSTCMAFAAVLREGKSELSRCTVLDLPEHAEKQTALRGMLGGGKITSDEHAPHSAILPSEP